jgi:hypothetical protein
MTIWKEHATKKEFISPSRPPYDNRASVPGLLYPARSNWFTLAVEGQQLWQLFSREYLAAVRDRQEPPRQAAEAIKDQWNALLKAGIGGK